MKQFYWKIFWCVFPCVLAAWATFDATIKYYNGDSGGFKLGVDLVGGTILVYEIDLRKNVGDEKTFDPVKDINILAESLKRRIDPTDTYNIIIRSAGGEGRIEIILPTGGTHRSKKAEASWRKLLDEVEEEYLAEVPGEKGKKIAVGRGKILELADQIQAKKSETIWKEKLFSSKEGWDRLLASALKYWAKIDNDIRGTPPEGKDQDEQLAKLRELKLADMTEKNVYGDTDLLKKLQELRKPENVGNLEKFSSFVIDTLAGTSSETSKKTIENWYKKQAWDETLTRVREKWKFLEPYRADMERINPDSTEQLTTFVLTRGSVIGQAGLALLQPLMGDKLERVFDSDEDPYAKDVRKFIFELYGPPVQEITEFINKKMSEKDRTKDTSVEDVQRIKDLVSKVGSLEFRILANSTDDAKAIDDAAKLINTADAEILKEIDKAQKEGLPPPAPREMRQGKLQARKYVIKTARQESAVSYSWVELGTTERKSLNLDNAARTDAARNAAWHYARVKRHQATQLPEVAGQTDRFILQGALFYSRECKDRNLPEEERRKKEVEYFVLTRDPEFENLNSEVRTPKIDGSYLVSAYGAPGADLRPTVHFTFNTDGGNLFGNITRKNVSEDTGAPATQKKRHLAIILDGMVMSAPTINSEIRTQGQISGNFTQKEVDSLVNILRAGRLPATLKPQPVSESTIAATLGEDTIAMGVRAILLSFAAVLAFMVIYYRFAGMVASIALMANLLLTVGFMVAVQATFTLSGLAGIVLTLGMAVDANVLIYERLREERERGASLLQAIRNGYDRALPTIIDTHLSSIFTAIVLYVVGNDNLKGFAVSMTVGLIISLFTSLYMTRLMFDMWQHQGWLTKLTMMRLFARPDWDFMSIRYVMFAITLGLAVLGGALFIGRLPNDLNIDFVGGTAYGGKLTTGILIKDLRPKFEEKNQAKVLEGVIVKELDESKRRYEITFPKGDNKPRTISLNNEPDFKTQAEREKNVQERCSSLPDPSVELLFNSTNDDAIKKEMDEGKSRNFVIRTTEKEPEIVQACADQILRDENGKQLLDKVFARYDKLEANETRFHFFATEAEAKDPTVKTETATASQSFFKSLLNRELRRSFDLKEEKQPLPFVLEVTAEGNSDSDGKYKVMKVTLEGMTAEHKEKVEAAFQSTVTSFAARPLPDRLENFDSALANETRFRAMWAVLASWAAILMYLWFRFGNWTFGLAAVICLVHDLFFTLGAIAVCHFFHGGPLGFIGTALLLDDFKLDLASVAALLTLVGYSVNDTIVVFDRIREVRGKNPELTPKMINDSINQTLSRTVLASLTVWLVVFVLYLFGGPGVHLFAFVMVIGVIVGTYSSIYIASPLLLFFGEGKHEETPAPSPVTPMPQVAGPETAIKA